MSDTDAVKILKGLKKKYEVELEEMLQADIYDEEKQHLTEVFGAQVEAISEALGLIEKSEKSADLESPTSSTVKQKYASQLEEFYKASELKNTPHLPIDWPDLVDRILSVIDYTSEIDMRQEPLSIGVLYPDEQPVNIDDRALVAEIYNEEQEGDTYFGTVTLHEEDARKLKEILELFLEQKELLRIADRYLCDTGKYKHGDEYLCDTGKYED